MERVRWWLLAVAWLAVASAFPARGQLVADGATKTINGATTNLTGDLVVGTNGSFTSLIVTNAGVVTNTANGTIGLNVSAKTNQVIVTGANSRWGMGGQRPTCATPGFRSCRPTSSRVQQSRCCG